MTAQAPGAFAQAPIRGTAPAVLTAMASAAPEAEVALSPAVRRRAAFTGLGLAALALAVTTVLALLIAAGPFHTSLGSIG